MRGTTYPKAYGLCDRADQSAKETCLLEHEHFKEFANSVRLLKFDCATPATT